MDHKPQKRTKSDDDHDQTQHEHPPLVHRHLHDDLLENIFTFLPIKEAVRIGTISTRFKKTWHLNRRLLFGRQFALRYSQQELVALLERIFDSNEAPKIQAFCLHMDPEGVQPLIEKWLRICIAKEIEELELQFLQPFFLTSHFLDIQTLRTLKLVNCGIQVPRVLTGLRFLNTLVLRQLDLTEQKLEGLVSHCKLLGTLDLSECWRIRVLNVRHKSMTILKIACCPDVYGIHIDVPSLRSIFFCGIVITIQFARVLPLKEAFIKFLPSRGYLQSHKIEHLAIDFFHVTLLSTSSIFLEALAARIRNGQYREMEFCLGNLKELQVFMEGGTFCDPYDIAVFLKSCPCMEVLFINLNDFNYKCVLFWKLHQKPMLDSFPYYFTRLKFIKLIGFKFEEYELELVKVLLQKSINLKVLVFITPRKNPTRLMYEPCAIYYKHLFQCWTASRRAKIYFFEHYDDRSFMYPSHPKYWY